MSKQSLLLVDGDTRSMRVLEVSLRKAGFNVTTAATIQEALAKLQLEEPDLIISETNFGAAAAVGASPDDDGFELRRRVRAKPEWREIPFIFLTSESAIENKIRGLELGVDDYLTKPIYVKEIVTRINILLQKRRRTRSEERRDGRTRFAGRVADMPVVDVIQTIEISRKSGVIQFVGDRGRQAAIYFRDGRVIDAEAGTLQGEDAVYRILTWSEGEFEVEFRTVRRRDVIGTSSQGLLMEGMRRLDEWSRLLEQLPPLGHRFEVDAGELSQRLGDVPDDNNPLLRLLDGRRTLLEVIDASDVGDLECLQAISRLYFEEMLIDLDHGVSGRRDIGRAVSVIDAEPTRPIEERVPDAALEASDAGAIEELEDTEPLLGGYRPSGLRLIDEAVAAAQAIEPLFEGAAGASDASESPSDRSSGVPLGPSEDEAVTVRGIAEHCVVDARMGGSSGRERAETSGELTFDASANAARSVTQREFVTILPRRPTQEPPMRNDVAASSPSAAPVESPRVRTRLRPATGTTTRIASTSGTSAGTVAKVLAVGIVALVALVAYLAYASRGESALVDPRAGVATTPPRDALAAVADVSRDGDAAAPVDPVVTQRGDRERATEFEDQSNRALEHKEFARALELAESALELRPTTSAYVLKARALERLRRFDAALDVLDQAEQTTSNKLQILGMRGRILWESGQKKSARTIMETYLEHAPSGKMAPQFHEWLDKAP